MGFSFKNIVDDVITNAKSISEDLVSDTRKALVENIPNKEKIINKATSFFSTDKDENKNKDRQEDLKENMIGHTPASNEMVVIECDKENLSDEEKSSTMLKIMDWAYEKANSNIPGLGSSEEMAAEYLKKCNGNTEEAVDSLIRWQTTYAGSAGFASSFGGFTTMVVTLPANIASVLAIQLRMIGAIAHLAGDHILTEEKKTASYICLLGAEAGSVISNVASEFTVKFMTSSLKNLSGAALTKINQAVGFRLFTKFGTKGLINLGKLIPLLGGVVGASIDALSTYSVAQTAKAMFLKDIINFEQHEKIEVTRFQILANMALIDGKYDQEEKNELISIAESVNVTDKSKEEILKIIESPKRTEIDFTPFKGNIMLSACLLESLKNVIMADGTYSVAEKIYMKSIGNELGYTEEDLKNLMEL